MSKKVLDKIFALLVMDILAVYTAVKKPKLTKSTTLVFILPPYSTPYLLKSVTKPYIMKISSAVQIGVFATSKLEIMLHLTLPMPKKYLTTDG